MSENKETEQLRENIRARASILERIVRQRMPKLDVEWLIIIERYWYALMIIAATFWIIESVITDDKFGIAVFLLFFAYHWKGIIKDNGLYNDLVLLKQIRRFAAKQDLAD